MANASLSRALQRSAKVTGLAQKIQVGPRF
jgi:hypothetical protein